MSKEDIENVFDGEGRRAMITLKGELLKQFETLKIVTNDDGTEGGNQTEAIKSVNFPDDEAGIKSLTEALSGVAKESLAEVFDGETRESVLALYVELTK